MATFTCAVCNKNIGQELKTVHSHSNEESMSIRVHRIHDGACNEEWMSKIRQNGSCHLCPDKMVVEKLNNRDVKFINRNNPDPNVNS